VAALLYSIDTRSGVIMSTDVDWLGKLVLLTWEIGKTANKKYFTNLTSRIIHTIVLLRTQHSRGDSILITIHYGTLHYIKLYYTTWTQSLNLALIWTKQDHRLGRIISTHNGVWYSQAWKWIFQWGR
jgi:hypothetical protein